MATPEGSSVMVAPYPMVKVESAQDHVIEDQDQQGMRYEPPDLGIL